MQVPVRVLAGDAGRRRPARRLPAACAAPQRRRRPAPTGRLRHRTGRPPTSEGPFRRLVSARTGRWRRRACRRSPLPRSLARSGVGRRCGWSAPDRQRSSACVTASPKARCGRPPDVVSGRLRTCRSSFSTTPHQPPASASPPSVDPPGAGVGRLPERCCANRATTGATRRHAADGTRSRTSTCPPRRSSGRSGVIERAVGQGALRASGERPSRVLELTRSRCTERCSSSPGPGTVSLRTRGRARRACRSGAGAHPGRACRPVALRPAVRPPSRPAGSGPGAR